LAIGHGKVLGAVPGGGRAVGFLIAFAALSVNTYE
jgi:hypothetical protein